MSEGQNQSPFLMRYPLIPLSYDDRVKAKPREILVDYFNAKVYILSDDGSTFIDLTAGLIGDIPTDAIEVLYEGQTITLTQMLAIIEEKMSSIDYVSYVSNAPKLPNTIAGDAELTLNGGIKITKDYPLQPVSPTNGQMFDYLDNVFYMSVSGKNLVRNAATFPLTNSGVTLSYNPDTQEYTLNGTATSGDLIMFAPAQLFLKGKIGDKISSTIIRVSGTNTGDLTLRSRDNVRGDYLTAVTLGTADTSKSATDTLTRDLTGNDLFFVITSGVVYTNLVVKIQIEYGDPTAWEKSASITPVAIYLKDTSNVTLDALMAIPATYNDDGTAKTLCAFDRVMRKSDYKWYLERNIKVVNMTTLNSFGSSYTDYDMAYFYTPDRKIGTDVICNKLKYSGTTPDSNAVFVSGSAVNIRVSLARDLTGITDADDTATKLTKMNTYLAAHPMIVSYVLATPVYTELLDTAQTALNSISKTCDGVTGMDMAPFIGDIAINYNPLRGHINNQFKHLTYDQKLLINNLPATLATKYASANDVLGAATTVYMMMNTNRDALAGAGNQNSALAIGGSVTGTQSAITEKFNGIVWSNTGNLNTARKEIAGCGLQDAALAFGGTNGAVSAVTEVFNGSVWSNTGALTTARSQLAGCGLSSAALAFGGTTGAVSAVTSIFNGSVWALTGSLLTARTWLAGCGITSAGLAFGGYVASSSAITEIFNGTVWTASGNLNIARYTHSGCGASSSAGLAFGSSLVAEKFNGSTWTTTGSANGARSMGAGCGVQTAGLTFGGTSNFTEKFNTDSWIQILATNIKSMINNKIDSSGGRITGQLEANIINANYVSGGVWNDYAEYRQSLEYIKPGHVVIEDPSDDENEYVIPCNERLAPNPMVVSDTFGFSIGQQNIAGEHSVPIAVSGRVLVYPDTNRMLFKKNDVVCAGRGGTVSKMTPEEIIKYPDRILGIVSAIPNYLIWGDGRVLVDERIWIKIK